MGQITKKTGSVKNADVAMPDEGSAQYDDLMEETGGAAASDGFDLAAHIAATSGADAVEDDDETDDASDDPVIDPVSEQDDESADQYDSRFDSEEDAIRYAEETIQGPLTRDDDGTLVNQYGEVMVYDSDGNLAPKPRDPIALDDQAPFSGADDQLEDSRAPEFNVELPAVGSAEYEALMFETGGAAANDGFNYQAHLAATGQLDKLVELDPDYDPELDPVFDDGFEPPFDPFSPEAGIDRNGLVGAATFEEFLEQTNGVDVGALGAYLTPEEITQVLDRFGGDPEFEAFVGGPVAPPPGGFDPAFPGDTGIPGDPGFIGPPPPAYIPPEEQLGAIRGGGRDDKKSAVLDLFAEAGDFDSFASGLASSLSPAEIDALIADLADDAEVWATLGMDMPVMPPPAPEFGNPNDQEIQPEVAPVPEDTVSGPLFVPRDEDLTVIRTADKETKKGVIFDLLDESGTVDAFLNGLGNSLQSEEIDALVVEFADDSEIWETLGIPQPVLTPADNAIAGTSLAGGDAPLDTPLDGEQANLDLIGLGSEVGI